MYSPAWEHSKSTAPDPVIGADTTTHMTSQYAHAAFVIVLLLLASLFRINYLIAI